MDKKIARILELALKLSNNREYIEALNYPSAIIQFYGHTADFQVRIFGKGWYMSDEPTYNKFFKIDDEKNIEIDNAISILEGYVKEWCK